VISHQDGLDNSDSEADEELLSKFYIEV